MDILNHLLLFPNINILNYVLMDLLLNRTENLIIPFYIDPIAVPINKLEQDNYGNPKSFNNLVKEMVSGKEGKLRILDANRLLPKVSYNNKNIYLKNEYL